MVKFWQSHGKSLLFRLARREGLPLEEAPDGDGSNTSRTHPRVRDGGAYTGALAPDQGARHGLPADFAPIAKGLAVLRGTMPGQSPIRAQIRASGPNGIAQVASLGLGDPDIIAAVVRRERPGHPGLHPRRRQAGAGRRQDLLHQRPRHPAAARGDRAISTSAPAAPISRSDRITVPGAAMLAVITRAAMRGRDRRQYRRASRRSGRTFSRPRRSAAPKSQLRAAGRRLDASRRAGGSICEKLFDACDARTKAIFIASPGNPTGWMMTRDEQKRGAGIRARARHRHHQRRSLRHAGL